MLRLRTWCGRSGDAGRTRTVSAPDRARTSFRPTFIGRCWRCCPTARCTKRLPTKSTPPTGRATAADFKLTNARDRRPGRAAAVAVAGRSRRARLARIQSGRVFQAARGPGVSFRGFRGAGGQGAGAIRCRNCFAKPSGYMIKPHPDTRQEGRDDADRPAGRRQPEALGHRVLSPQLQPACTCCASRADSKWPSRPPFLPNVAYAFAVINALTLKSWHGRTTLGGRGGRAKHDSEHLVRRGGARERGYRGAVL